MLVPDIQNLGNNDYLQIWQVIRECKDDSEFFSNSVSTSLL